MRAPSATLRNEITAFRQHFVSDPAPINVANRWRYEFTLEILDRWERHPEAEKTWRKIWKEIKVEQTPGEFIAAVIQERVQAESLARIMKEAPAIEANVRTHVEQYGEYFGGGDRLAREIPEFDKFRSLKKRVLPREATGPRTHFMAAMRWRFKQLTRKPNDPLVAALTNIVFGLEDDDAVTPESVRATRGRLQGG
jgi:hypothetical protein